MKLRRFVIAESSMSPYLQEHDYVITIRRAPAFADVVVFEHPHRPGFYLTKRVIGTEGQEVEIRDGRVFIDGREADEPWTADETSPDGWWRITAGQVFVLGDARHRSSDDSRTLGPIQVGPAAHVVTARYWPLGRAGRIKNRNRALRE